MARLYSDLLDGSGRRYYFGLTSAPGGITNAAPALLTIFGRTATIQEQTTVFRTPATALLTLNGLAPPAGVILQPALAALSLGGQIPGLAKLKVITNALPPDYNEPAAIPPTILFIATQTPAPAALQIQSLEHNITQGGNIGFMSPGVASLTLAGFSANFPRFADVTTLTVTGLLPTITTELVITPETAVMTAAGLAVALATPFVWIDEEPVATTTWIDDARA